MADTTHTTHPSPVPDPAPPKSPVRPPVAGPDRRLRHSRTVRTVTAMLVLTTVAAIWLTADWGLIGVGLGLAAISGVYAAALALLRTTTRPADAPADAQLGAGAQHGGAAPTESGEAVRVWTGDDIRALGVSTTLANAAQIFGLSLPAAYRLVKHDTFPVPVVRVGRGYRIPVAPILTALHLHRADPDTAGTDGGGRVRTPPKPSPGADLQTLPSHPPVREPVATSTDDRADADPLRPPSPSHPERDDLA